MNGKKLACILLSLLIGSSITSYADVPKGTVVIDNKAYDLNYANKEMNFNEIYTQYKNSVSEIYVKGFNGKWYNNSNGKEISKEFIPQVTYKDESGKVFDYSQEDGVEIELAAEKASFINGNQVKIQFNKIMMQESVLNKSNYKIGEKDLSENDIIEFEEDGKTVIITLENKVEGKIIDTSIFISEKILDINNNSLNNDFAQNILVINDVEAELDKEINKDINIIVDNYNINDMKINGDIYINADNVKVNKVVSSGNIIINEGENRKAELSNSEFKKVYVLSSGEESNTLNSIKADTLILNNIDDVKILAKGSTEINKTIIQSGVNIDLISGSLGEVTINIEKGDQSLLQLKGKFKDPIIMESGARFNILQESEVEKLDVRPFFRDSIISIEGTVNNIEVNRESTLNILEKGNITNEILVNCKAKINGEKGSKVSKLNISPNNNIDKINISGEFELIEITEEANIQFDENTVINKLVAYKNAVLNGDQTVKVKEIQAGEDVEVIKKDSNKGFELPEINPIEEKTTPPINSGGGWYPPSVTNSKPEAKDISISGELKVGEELTGDYEFYDKNSDKEGKSIIKWYRAYDKNGKNKTAISDEDSKTYTLTDSDIGKYISFEVTPVAKSGEKTGKAVMSKFVGPVEEVVVEKDTEKPVITLNGSKTIELEVGDVYEDAGATAVDNEDGDITGKIVMTIKDQEGNEVDKVDAATAGEYIIHYNVSDKAGNTATEVTRTVIVKEVSQNEPVKIEVDGYNVKITVEGEGIKDSVSMRIINNETGDVEDIQTKASAENKVVFERRIEKAGEFTAYINAFKDGEIIEKTFAIQAEDLNNDTVKPILTLKGNSYVELEVGDVYEDAGATALDNVDGDITDTIVVTIVDENGNQVQGIDTIRAAVYTIYYSVIDEAGNTADSIKRNVVVKDSTQDERVQVDVDGYNVKITVEGEGIRDFVSIRVINNETGDVEDIQTKSSAENKVVFERRIEKAGEFTAYINAFKDGDKIEKTFIIIN